MQKEERFLGALVGLAAGDALGTTLEFQQPGTFEPLTDMVGGGPFGLRPGEWTDDTSLALCLAESLVETQGFDPIDQLERYLRWYQDGHLSSTGTCFDIGMTTRASLLQFEATGEPYRASTNKYSAGNGSLMRLAPVPMFFANRPEEAIERSGDSSKTTHAAQTCVDSCRFYAGLLCGALNGIPKEELLVPRYAPIPGYWTDHALSPEVDDVAAGSFRWKEPPEISGSGYVVACYGGRPVGLRQLGVVRRRRPDGGEPG